MLNAAIVDTCVAWRQTSDCNPSGTRAPENDKNCDEIISDGDPGYCECHGGIIRMPKGCENGGFATCNDACSGGKCHSHNTDYVCYYAAFIL